MTSLYPDINAAYVASLRELAARGAVVPSVADASSVGSAFGQQDRPFRELRNHSFELADPRNRLLTHPCRPLNIPFAVANALWTLAGSNSLTFIQPYNQRGAHFSDDQHTLHGAHGKRLFDSDGTDQVTAALERLRADPHSRRAVAIVLQPQDAISRSRDIPCLISLQFMQREGELHCVANMRSQSAAMVLPYDVFAVTFLQECLAVELGLSPGCYYHNSASFHYYLDEEATVRHVLASPLTPDRLSPPAPMMPTGISPFAAVRELLHYEQALRVALRVRQPSAPQVPAPPVPEYWRDLGLILACGLCRAGDVDEVSVRQQLSPYWGRLLGTHRPRQSEGVLA
jgi:hypothetical protein